jgi:hypothetical protein
MRKQMKRFLIGGLACAAISMAASPTQAAPIVLTDHNSSVTIDPDSEMGMRDWVVEGVDHLFQQWFWYRIGTNPEAPINTLSAAMTISGNTNFDPGLDTATVRYEDSQLIIEVKYSLLGGSVGSGNSDVGEQIKVANKTNAALDFHLFQYSDFDLNGTSGGDMVQMLGSNAVRQWDVLGGPSAGEAVSLPFSSHHEVDFVGNTHARLSDGFANTFNDTNTAGPGDVSFAFQWDFTLQAANTAGSDIVISKNKNIFGPEPASVVLFGMGLISAAGVARRRKAVAPQA